MCSVCHVYILCASFATIQVTYVSAAGVQDLCVVFIPGGVVCVLFLQSLPLSLSVFLA